MGSFISHVMITLSPLLPPPTISTRGDSGFADLPQEILILVLERLRLVDRVNFGSVCSSFHSAFTAQQRLSYSPSTPPWILLPEKSTDTAIAFFSVAESRVYKIRQSGLLYTRQLCLGSSTDGWLVAMDQGTSLISLFNPVTGNRIRIPPIVSADSSSQLLCLELSKAIVCWNYYTCSEKGYTVVFLLAWPSSAWPSTMLRVRDNNGHKPWTPFGSAEDIYTDGVFQNSHFYALQSNGTVEVWDLTADPTPLTTIVMPQNSSLSSSTRYLVRCSEDRILQVCRSSPDLEKIEFQTFKLDLSNKEWVEIESLADQVLFLNSYCSMALSTRTYPEFEANCIFLDCLTPGKDLKTLVLMMQDKRLKKVIDHGSYWNKPSPIWITPSLLRIDCSH